MVGQDLLGLMSIWGRQAVSGRTPDGDDGRERGMFGGLSTILVGDPMQLPLVGAAPMWSDRPGTAGHSVEGRVVWLGLNAGVELTEVMRQVGEAQAAFRRTLLAVAEGRAQKELFDLLWSRMRSQVPQVEQETFYYAVHLLPTNSEADDRNWERLNLLGADVALIVASHTVGGYTNVSAERFRNLAPNLYLAVGARVSSTTCGRPPDSRMVRLDISRICTGGDGLGHRGRLHSLRLSSCGFITYVVSSSSPSGRLLSTGSPLTSLTLCLSSPRRLRMKWVLKPATGGRNGLAATDINYR